MSPPLHNNQLQTLIASINEVHCCHISIVTANVYPDLRQARITESVFTKEDIAIIFTPDDAHFDIAMECISKGMHIVITKPIVHRYSKPDKGELYKPFEIVPEVSIKTNTEIIIANSNEEITVNVTVKAMRDDVDGTIIIDMSKNWSATPATKKIHLSKKEGGVQVTDKSQPSSLEKLTSMFSGQLEITGAIVSFTTCTKLQEAVLPNSSVAV